MSGKNQSPNSRLEQRMEELRVGIEEASRLLEEERKFTSKLKLKHK